MANLYIFISQPFINKIIYIFISYPFQKHCIWWYYFSQFIIPIGLIRSMIQRCPSWVIIMRHLFAFSLSFAYPFNINVSYWWLLPTFLGSPSSTTRMKLILNHSLIIMSSRLGLLIKPFPLKHRNDNHVKANNCNHPPKNNLKFLSVLQTFCQRGGYLRRTWSCYLPYRKPSPQQRSWNLSWNCAECQFNSSYLKRGRSAQWKKCCTKSQWH